MSEHVFYEVCRRDERGSLCGPYAVVSSRAFEPRGPGPERMAELQKKLSLGDAERDRLRDGAKVSAADQAREAAEDLGREMFGEQAVVQEGNPGHLGAWGFGRGYEGRGWRPFGRVDVAGHPWELSFGEHPHARCDKSMYARPVGQEGGEPVGFDGHRPLLRVVLSEHNRLKESGISGDEVRGSCSADVYADDQLVYRAHGRAVRDVLVHLASVLPHKVHEHCPALWDPKERAGVVGRLVYYRYTPAVVLHFDAEHLEVELLATGEARAFPPWPFQLEDMEPGEEREARTRERVGFYSELISWHRKKPAPGDAAARAALTAGETRLLGECSAEQGGTA